MRDDLLLYYERELDYLRKMAVQFAEKNPKVASRLVLEATKCEDPHVERLLEAFADTPAAFVYDLGVVREAARALRALGSISRVHYSMKANPHAQLLRALQPSPAPQRARRRLPSHLLDLQTPVPPLHHAPCSMSLSF